jgi:hypothetical protein
VVQGYDLFNHVYKGRPIQFRDDPWAQTNGSDCSIRWGGFTADANDHAIATNVDLNGIVLDSGSNLTMRIGGVTKLRLTSNGGLFVAGAVTPNHNGFSDDRLKTNETPLQGALATVQKLQPLTYTKQLPETTEEFANKDIVQEMLREPQYEAGLIAHDLWNAAPELRHIVHGVVEEREANFDTDGRLREEHRSATGEVQYLRIGYDQLIPYLIASIQELNARLEAAGI